MPKRIEDTRELKAGDAVRYHQKGREVWTYGRVSGLINGVAVIHNQIGESGIDSDNVLGPSQIRDGYVVEKVPKSALDGMKISYEDN